jgi:hypothetical protein
VAASRRARLALLAVSTAASLLLAEGALRVAGVSHPNFYRPDPRRGWSLRPGAEGWQRKEGEAYVRINRDGLRDDRDHPREKPPGELRIAVLGDSCVEAVQVPLERTFWSLLEERLPRCERFRGRPVEALGFGVSGYGTAQALITQREEVWKYRPDLVLLAFYAGNDVRNNDRALDQDPARPYFVLPKGPTGPTGSTGPLALDDSFRSSPGYRFRTAAPGRLLYGAFDHSRLLQLGKQAKGAVDGWVGAWRASRVEAAAAVRELGLDNAVYSPPRDENWARAWKVTEAMLRALRDDAAAHATPFGVVSLTTGAQVHPDPAARRELMEQLGLETLFYPDERVAAFGRAEGIPVLALAPDLQRLAEREGAYLHGFANTPPGEGHWNERGHAAAAERIAEWLCGPASPLPPSTPGRPGWKPGLAQTPDLRSE